MKNKKPKILAELKPGETKTIEGIIITADEDNTSIVYIGKEGNVPIVWANRCAYIRLHFKEGAKMKTPEEPLMATLFKLMAQHTDLAIVSLLIDKGIFTLEEFQTKYNEAWEKFGRHY